ncbi:MULTISPECIES: hypothetical protein [unclassified Marinovum]
MSDPVKSSEIEDVLSSIRRLVSEEARSDKQARRNDAPKAPANVPERVREKTPEADALVLTPALRVHSGGLSRDEAEVGRVAREPDALRDAVMNVVADVVEEEAEAQVAAAIDPVADTTPKPDTDEYDAPEAAEYDAPEDADEEPEAVDHSTETMNNSVPDTAEVASEPSVAEPAAHIARDDDLPEPPAAAETLESKLTALEALIAGRNEAAVQQPSAAHEAETAQEWEDHLPEADTSEAPQDAAAVHDTAIAEAGLEDEQAGLDAAEEAHAPEDVPPQAEIAEDFAADLSDHVDEAPAASPSPKIQRPVIALAEARPGPEDAEEDEAVLPGREEDHSIDESVLRQMVVDIVREELQGALGERITRNVRRLVRREIHRALASHELD